MMLNKHLNYLLIIISHLLLAISIHAQPEPPKGYLWKIVPELSDEFYKWDSSKWHKPLWNYGEPVQMTKENSGVSRGKLWIKATLGNDEKRWFKTSRIQSNAKIKYPIYTESRIRTAHISAFNTFWLNNGDAENRDEIDIIENNSNPSCDCQPDYPWQMNSQYFITKNKKDEREKDNFDNRKLSASNPFRGIKWNDIYHTVGAWWIDKNTVQFYLDGEPAGRVKSKKNFTRELNLIWDLWTKDVDWLGGIAQKENLKDDKLNTMYVDWVHTYRLKKGKMAPIKVGSKFFTIEGEEFTKSGGVFDDRFAGGPGNGVRNTGSVVDFVNTGDWIEYEVNIAYPGKYDIEYTISTPTTYGSQIQFLVDNKKMATTDVPTTISWTVYKSLSGGSAVFTAGVHIIKLVGSGDNNWQWNLDKFTLKKKR